MQQLGPFAEERITYNILLFSKLKYIVLDLDIVPTTGWEHFSIQLRAVIGSPIAPKATP